MEYIEDFFSKGWKSLKSVTVPSGQYLPVVVVGRVKKNKVASEHPLSGVKVGERVTMSFLVDPNRKSKKRFGDSQGYELVRQSFTLALGQSLKVKLQDPWPAKTEPYFVMYEHEWRDHYLDPHNTQDGFQIGSGADAPAGLPLALAPLSPDGGSSGQKLNVQAALDVRFPGGTYPNMHDSKLIRAVGEYNPPNLKGKGSLKTESALQLWVGSPDNTLLDIAFENLRIHSPQSSPGPQAHAPAAPRAPATAAAGASPSAVFGPMPLKVSNEAADDSALVAPRGGGAAVAAGGAAAGGAAGAILAFFMYLCWSKGCRRCLRGGGSSPRERAPPRAIGKDGLFRSAAPERLAPRRAERTRRLSDDGVLGTLPPAPPDRHGSGAAVAQPSDGHV